MKDIDLKELNLNNLAIWPMPIKASVIAICCLLILGLGYWFDISEQFNILESVQQKELTLRSEFQTKVTQAASLPAYKNQLQEIQQILSGMVQQLPNSTEIPSLLEEISKAGVTNGLQFNLFKPMPEIDLGYFIELPIQISVTGNYHQLGLFVSQIAGLNRIVTLQDFSIEPYKDKMSATKEVAMPTEERLVMDITAKTYRYSEASPPTDKAGKKAGDKDNKKQ